MHFLGSGVGLLTSAHIMSAINPFAFLETDINVNPLRTNLFKNELKIATVTAHTADELSNEEKDDLQLQIEKIIGKNTELTTVIDSSLIGGLKLRIDNIFLDASIKTKMENLRKDLLQ